MPLELPQFCKRLGVPDPNRIVVRPGDDAGAVGHHRDGFDRALMAPEDGDLSHRAQGTVESGGGERPMWPALDHGVIARCVKKALESEKNTSYRIVVIRLLP